MKNTNPNAKHRNPFAQAAWVESPSHAWLAIPRELLKRFDLEQSISEYSYQQNHKDGTPLVFLEEDSDAHKVIKKIGGRLYAIADGNGWIKTIHVYDKFFNWAEKYEATWNI